jgi:hypothetical protein
LHIDAHLAHVLMGEAGICGPLGMLAVAWVYSRNPIMYGFSTPNKDAAWMSVWWSALPDPTQGATMIFSNSDLELPQVQRLIRDKSPTLHLDCEGLGLTSY